LQLVKFHESVIQTVLIHAYLLRPQSSHSKAIEDQGIKATSTRQLSRSTASSYFDLFDSLFDELDPLSQVLGAISGRRSRKMGSDTVVEVHFIPFRKSRDSLSLWDEFQQPYSLWVLSFSLLPWDLVGKRFPP
jgi:hypothetical protein